MGIYLDDGRIVSAEDLWGDAPVQPEEPTERAVAELEAIFGESIDYDAVTVINGDPGLLDVSGGRPFVPGNSTIVLNGLDPNTEWSEFVHEMVHVWQSQNTGNGYIPQAQYAQERGQGYNVPAAFSDGATPGCDDLNPEQQGELLVAAVESGYLENPGMQIYVRSRGDDENTGGLHNSFDAEAVSITDTDEVASHEGDPDWINVTPLLVEGLDRLHS